jgi:uncharacterized protein involved in exopolysaccharide biosynthesis
MAGLMNGEIPVARIVAVLLRPWKWMVAASAAGALAAFAFAMTQPNVYRAEVLISPVKSDGSGAGLGAIAQRLGGLASYAGLSTSGGSDAAELVALLKSRQMAERFIEMHGLLPVLYEDRWDARAGAWRPEEGGTSPTIRAGAKRFNSEIKAVTENKVTGMVAVSIDWTDPDLAAKWANLFVDDVSEFARGRALEESRRTVSYLESQLQNQQRMETRNAIFSAIEGQLTQQAMAASRPDFAFRIIDPAVTPDVDSKVYPRRILFAVAGAIVGLLLSGAVAVILAIRDRSAGLPAA